MKRYCPQDETERPGRRPRGSPNTVIEAPFDTQEPVYQRGDEPYLKFKSRTDSEDEIFEWIPAPPEGDDEFEEMSQPSKRARSPSASNDDHGRTRSVSPSGTGVASTSSSRDTKLQAYKATNYAAILESKYCFMQPSGAGLAQEDISLCQRLDRPLAGYPQGTMFEDAYIGAFEIALQGRSEARLSTDLHPLLMPSAENLFIRGRTELKHVIDGYNDPWIKTEPIYGPRPQPDHARGLRSSTFSEAQRRKLGITPDGKSFYAVRDDTYFPYLTAEIKCGNQPMEIAERQNMHSMCVALRGVVSLARAAGLVEEVNGRLLGFSISHNHQYAQLHGYYPEIGEKENYYRRHLKRFDLWADRWACYRFVENLDREFLPLHTARLMRFLDRIPDPQDVVPAPGSRDEVDSQLRSDSQTRLPFRRVPSSQSLAMTSELRGMIRNLQQQLEERDEKYKADQQAREAAQEMKHKAEQQELKATLLDQLAQQRAEQRAGEERHRAQEQAREERHTKERQALEERLFRLLEQK